MRDANELFSLVAIFGWRYWHVVLSLLAVLVLASPFLLKGLRIETASASFIASDDPVSRVYLESLERFGENDPLVIQILFGSAPGPAVDAFTQRLTEDISTWSDVAWVESRPEAFLAGRRAIALARASLLNSGDGTIQAVLARLDPDAMNRRIRRRPGSNKG